MRAVFCAAICLQRRVPSVPNCRRKKIAVRKRVTTGHWIAWTFSCSCHGASFGYIPLSSGPNVIHELK